MSPDLKVSLGRGFRTPSLARGPPGLFFFCCAGRLAVHAMPGGLSGTRRDFVSVTMPRLNCSGHGGLPIPRSPNQSNLQRAEPWAVGRCCGLCSACWLHDLSRAAARPRPVRAAGVGLGDARCPLPSGWNWARRGSFCPPFNGGGGCGRLNALCTAPGQTEPPGVTRAVAGGVPACVPAGAR